MYCSCDFFSENLLKRRKLVDKIKIAVILMVSHKRGGFNKGEEEESHMADEAFASRLAELLKKQGMTQKELSERIGVTEATVSRYMNGNRIPKSEIVANIATALHTTSDYLLGTEKEGDINDDYPRIVRLIARNSAKLTNEQKRAIVNALLEND